MDVCGYVCTGPGRTPSKFAPAPAVRVRVVEMAQLSWELYALAWGERTCHVVEAARCMQPSTGAGEGECTSEDELLSALVSTERACMVAVKPPVSNVCALVHNELPVWKLKASVYAGMSASVKSESV